MTIRLGLDASQRIPSCAVSTDKGIVAVSTADKPIENFSTLIRETLFKAHVSLEDLDEIVVCIGPGSQMGVRATVVTGNALALALGLPITGVLSTDALAVVSPVRELQNIAVPAGKIRWYVEAYNWNGDKLQRLDRLQLLDELPSDTDSDSIDFNTTKLCAQGILMVAEQQRHLITQSLVREITPYERGDHDGI